MACLTLDTYITTAYGIAAYAVIDTFHYDTKTFARAWLRT
jgi:hypothetical protein